MMAVPPRGDDPPIPPAPPAGGNTAGPPRGDDLPISPAPPAGGNTAAIETSGLAKRYRRVTALSDCTISVPAGRISALVGPNGAGKTTLLRLLTGLAAPTAGRATVLGATPRQDPRYLAEIGFLAQDVPLYRRLTAQDHIGIGAHLNPRWDGDSVRARLSGRRIPLDQRVGTLSGGQRAQLALALTLAKRPRVLLLDEPLAALDPLARQHFLAALAEAAAVQGDLTIVLSSHLIADIERVCDHLILLADSRVQLCGDIDTLLAEHRVLVGPRKDTTAIARAHTIVQEDSTARQTTLLVRLNGPVLDPAWAVEETNLEEMVLGYMTQDSAGAGTDPAARLSAVGGDR
jgi:ABC-2 type transport system ATP-binding protein